MAWRRGGFDMFEAREWSLLLRFRDPPGELPGVENGRFQTTPGRDKVGTRVPRVPC